MAATSTNDEKKPTDAVKKPYTAPEMQQWGSLRDITQAVGNAGSSDGGRNGHKSRTRP